MKPNRILFVLLILFSFAAMSQEVSDSIAIINESMDADTVKIKKFLGLYHQNKVTAPEQALLAANAAFKLASEKDLVLYKAKALGFIGTANYNMDRYSEALEHYLLALQYYEKLDRKREQGVLLTNIGNIFLDQELPDQALIYYQRAMVIDKSLGLNSDIAMDLLNISSAYMVNSRLDSATILCAEALRMAEELKDTTMYAQCLGNLGIIEFQQKKYDLALKHMSEAEQLFIIHNIQSDVGALVLSLGDIYLEKKNIAKAIYYYSKALENAKATESIDDERLAYLGLSKCAEKNGNISLAYDYFKKYNVLNDSIFDFKSSRKQTHLLMNYELEKKDVIQKAEKEKREAIHAAELQRQRSQKNIFIAGFIIVFALSFIMLRLYRLKNKSNKTLSETLQHLEHTQSQLIHQEKMASLGMLTAGIAHEIQNPLNFVTNFSESSMEIIKELNETTDEKERHELLQGLLMNVEKISNHGKRADNIIKSMLRHSHGSPEEKKPTNINRLCDEFLMLAYHSIRASHPDFNCTIEKNFQEDIPKVNIMAQEITRVLLNLFTNAFHALKEQQQKVSEFKAVITVLTTMNNQHTEIRIRDNGTGISKEIRDKIFQPFFTTKKSGEGTGLGLSISYDIIKAHGGELIVESTEGEFTEFTIFLPV